MIVPLSTFAVALHVFIGLSGAGHEHGLFRTGSGSDRVLKSACLTDPVATASGSDIRFPYEGPMRNGRKTVS